MTVFNNGLSLTNTTPLSSGTVGSSLTIPLSAIGGNPPYTYSNPSSNLPAGLSVSGATITGTPTTSGVSTGITLRVTDNAALHDDGVSPYSITINCPALNITSSSVWPVATKGQAYSLGLSATGGTGTLTWGLSGQPSGLFINSSTGLVSGTPTVFGSFTPVPTVTDSCLPTGTVATQNASLTVNNNTGPLTLTVATPLTAGVVGTLQTIPLTATGGTPAYTYTNPSSNLPTGLSISGATITGTPTTSGTYSNITLRVTDNLSATNDGSSPYSEVITCPALSITSNSAWPAATKSQSYSLGLTASGGVGTRTWSATGLPTGLSINSSTGLVSGTPSVSGSFTPVPSVIDSCLPTGTTASQNATLTVNSNALTLTVSSPLSAGTVGVPLTIPLSAIGGTPPYTYTNPSSNLPAGLSISGATITGTPTTPGNYGSITLRVTDNVAATNDGSSPYTQVINAASADDSRYCNSSGNWTGPVTDGPAAAPLHCVYTPLSATPASGPTKTVCSSGCDYSTIQAAVNAAACGWIIQVKATSNGTPSGTQNVYGPAKITLPATACGANWIWLESSLIGDSSFPPEGSRASPAYVGIASLPARPAYAQPPVPGIYFPQIINNQTNTSTFQCTNGIAHWRIMGFEFATTSGVNVQNAVIACGGAGGVIFDRDIVHGGNNTVTPGKSVNTASQGIALDGGTYNAVINSYIYDIACLTGGCTDSYAIFAGGCSVNTTGSEKFVNNYFEAAGESGILTGGCGSGSSVVPATDIEYRRDSISKPLFWKTTDPTYFGTSFEVKNDWEMKNANRVFVEGLVVSYSWFGQSDQQGQLFDIGSKNQSNGVTGVASSSGSTLTRISGASFNSTMVSSSCANPNHCIIKYNGANFQAQSVPDGNHIILTTSPPTTASAAFTACQPGLNPNAIVSNVIIRYSILSHASRGIEMYAVASDCGDISLGTNTISIHDITMDDIDGFHWGSGAGGCCVWSIPYSVQNNFNTPNNMHDIWIHNTTNLAFLTGGSVGTGPSMSFGNQGAINGVVPNLKIFNNISTAGWAKGGGWITNALCAGPPGPPNTLAAFQCYDSLNAVPQNTFCFDGNVLATTTQAPVTGTGNTPPYPTSLQSPSCPYTPVGNFLPANFAAILFTNLNGAVGGNYTLQVGSPYHHAGSDGNDPGANITLVNQYVQGVQ